MKRKYLQYARSAVGVARDVGRVYKKLKGDFDERRSRAREKTENYTSVQFDAKTQYKKRRMPKRRRKAWVKFSRRVTAVLNKSQGTQTHVRNSSGTSTPYYNAVDTTNWRGPQCFACCTLYGAAGTTSVTGYTHGQDDLKTIMESANETLMGKFRFISAVLDITLSARFSGGNTVPLEVDVYHIQTYGPGKKTDSGLNDMFNIMKDTWQTPNANPTGDPRVTGLGRGETLFDIPGFLKISQWRIMRKTKMFVPAGGQITYQIRDASDHYVTGESFRTQTAANTWQYKKLTQHVVFMAKPVVGYTVAEGVPLFEIGVTRKYAYKVLEDNYTTTAKD